MRYNGGWRLPLAALGCLVIALLIGARMIAEPIPPQLSTEQIIMAADAVRHAMRRGEYVIEELDIEILDMEQDMIALQRKIAMRKATKKGVEEKIKNMK